MIGRLRFCFIMMLMLPTHLQTKCVELGFFNYQLENIYNKYRSKLKSINLFATCNVHYIKKYGMDKILEPLVEELKILSSDSGYPFEIAGGKVVC